MTEIADKNDAYLTASPIPQPLTLDDVSKRIDKICNDYVASVLRVKAQYDGALEMLAADVDASPDLDQDAAISVVMGRCQRMLTTASKAIA